MRPVAALLPDGKRLHLQHGPIDLVTYAEGDRSRAYQAAQDRFDTVLGGLVQELPELRAPLSPLTCAPSGLVARRMHRAAWPFRDAGYLTRMAAVAGSVADEVLAAMTAVADLRRAYVNNGGDIALHLTEGTRFATAIQGHDGRALGRIDIGWHDPVRGIATSGRHGRSLSLGIADSVTVLSGSAATADVAATLIANAVDVPGHPAIARRPACDVDDMTDLGDMPVVTGCGALSAAECQTALTAGRAQAQAFQKRGLILGAALTLQEFSEVSAPDLRCLTMAEESYA